MPRAPGIHRLLSLDKAASPPYPISYFCLVWGFFYVPLSRDVKNPQIVLLSSAPVLIPSTH